jgi:hypothetical protein
VAKIVLIFDTEQIGQQDEAMLALHAHSWKGSMEDLADWLRRQTKYGPDRGLEARTLEVMYKKLFEILQNRGLELWEGE